MERIPIRNYLFVIDDERKEEIKIIRKKEKNIKIEIYHLFSHYIPIKDSKF